MLIKVLQIRVAANVRALGGRALNTAEIARQCKRLMVAYNIGQRLFAKYVMNQVVKVKRFLLAYGLFNVVMLVMFRLCVWFDFGRKSWLLLHHFRLALASCPHLHSKSQLSPFLPGDISWLL